MLHTSNPIIKHKAGLLNLAEELGNVSRVCKVMGVSRDTFYRYHELVGEGGLDSLINKSRRTPHVKNSVSGGRTSGKPRTRGRHSPAGASLVRPVSRLNSG